MNGMGDSSGWQALPAWVRVGATVFAYVGGYLSLDWVSEAFIPAAEVAVWFPAVALNLVLLWTFGLRYMPAVGLAVLMTKTSIIAESGLPLAAVYPLMLVYALIQALGYGGLVFFLKKLEVNPRLYSLRDVSWFLFAVTLFPLFIAPLSVTMLALAGVELWGQWLLRVMQFWAGDVTGIGLLAPPLLITLRLTPWLWTDDLPKPRAELRLPTRREWWFGGGLLAFITLGTALAYRGERGLNLNRDYFAFVPLIAVAVWHGFEASAFAVLLANIMIAAIVGPSFSGADSLALQFGLMTLTLVSLVLGAITSARQNTETELQHRTLHDPLTGLPNREQLLARLGELQAQGGRQGQRALLMLDLDNFQTVNDSLGHDFGDALLCAVAERMREGLTHDTLAHLGGDEFVLLFTEADESSVTKAIRGLREVFAQPFRVQNRELRLSVGIGAALVGPADSAEAPAPTELLRRTHTALHRAKQQGKARTVFFEDVMHTQAVERLELENDLRRALEYQEFVIHYQPIWSLETGKIVEAEALLRWPHSERGLIAPATFVPLAEETGLIEPLSRWLMRSAFKQAKAWRSAGHTLNIAVNISAAQVQMGLEYALEDALEASALAPECVRLEVTESLFLEPSEDTIALLRRLTKRGVKVSVDDFGTGYSSLSYLKNLPIHALKIDRSFLKGIPGDEGDAAIVETILFMADALGLEVVAEGVETAAQMDFLLEQGCPYAQGYYLARSVSAAIFTSYLERPALSSKLSR